MVEVNKSNFDLMEKRIKNLLPSSLFVSIDLEFTGLRADPNRNRQRFTPNRHDLPSQLYIKSRQLIDNFLMIQFGICLWNKTPDSKSKITAYPFNFWSFPKHDTKSTFLCQTSSLVFLREHGFDFNKLIDQGINFLSIDEERRERENHDILEQKKKNRLNERKQLKTVVEPRTQKDVEFMQNVEQKIKEFAEQKHNENSEEILELGAVNRFRRLLIYQHIDRNYNNKLMAFKHDINDRNKNTNFKYYLKNISVKKVNTNSKKRFKNEQKNQFEKEWNDKIRNFIGIRRIFDVLCEQKVPIIVHNGFLDMMHLFRSFIGCLPCDPCIFAQRLHHHLPFIYDTRYIMHHLFHYKQHESIKNYSLSQCLQFFMRNIGDDDDCKDENEEMVTNIALDIDVCIEMDGNKKRNSEKEEQFLKSKDGTFHEAGYDAFCTGYIFTMIGGYLNLLNKKEYTSLCDVFHTKDEVHNADVSKKITLSHYVNRLNITKNYSKHFYVGNEYHLDHKFTMNDMMQKAYNDDDDSKNDNKYDGVFCGVDYNAINDDWHKMFFCWIKQEMEYDVDNIEKPVIQFLKKYISQKNRIGVYKRNGVEGQTAVIRIADITDVEHRDIVNGYGQQQPEDVQFMKYIDYKSNELLESYQSIYGFGYSNKKRVNNNRSLDTEVTEPPRKKQRTH